MTSFRPTPQQWTVAGLLLLAVILLGGHMVSLPEDRPIEQRVLHLPLPAPEAVIGAAEALGPVVASARRPRTINPFTLRADTTTIRVKIGEPPPPDLVLPDLPVLPLGKQVAP
ncbi:MAG: hypothetical protein ACOCZK_06530 [Planctomycetota bacterium]